MKTKIAGLVPVLLMILAATSAADDLVDPGCLASAKHLPLADKAAQDLAAGTAGYDVLRYDLFIGLDPDAASYEGVVSMHFALLDFEMEGIVLDASGFTVTGVEHAGDAVPFTHAGDSLLVDWMPSVKIGTQDSLRVTFEGALVGGASGLRMNRWDEDDPATVSVASMSQPSYARTWWPCKDRPGDKAVLNVSIKVPDDWTAVSNGRQWVTFYQGGTITYGWRTDHQIAPYLVSVAAGPYVEFGETCLAPLSGNVELRHWVFPPDLEHAQQDFSTLCSMMDFMENTAGPYPFADEKYGHVEFMNMNTGAMEHQTCTSYGHALIRGDNAYDWVALHELSHQWYGDSLTPESWKDIWLNEGFATYFEALWMEHLHGMDEADGYWDRMRSRRYNNNWIGFPTVYDPFPDVLDRVVYDKGSWMLHMLRGRFRALQGDDLRFFDLLHDWAQGPNRIEGVVTTQEFLDLASDYLGESVDAFLWPYLSESTVPHLQIATKAVDGSNGMGTRAEIVLRDLSGVDFDNRYPVRIVTEGAEHWRTLRMVGSSVEHVFDFLSPVLEIEIDPQGWLLWQGDEVPPRPLRITSLAPNPAKSELTVTFRQEFDATPTFKIFDVRGRLVDERTLGAAAGSLIEDLDFTWDGVDLEGRRVSSGSYWLELTSGGERAVRRFTVVR